MFLIVTIVLILNKKIDKYLQIAQSKVPHISKHILPNQG